MPKRIEFDAPDDWSSPEGKAIGDHVEVLVTVEIKSGGRLCLVELDGHKMKGYKDDEDDGKTYAQASSDAMDEQGGY